MPVAVVPASVKPRRKTPGIAPSKPVAAEPAVAEPAVAKPVAVAEPIAVAEPAVAESAVAESAVVKPRRKTPGIAPPKPIIEEPVVEEPVVEPAIKQVKSYHEQLKSALEKLDTNKEAYLKLDDEKYADLSDDEEHPRPINLATHSKKMNNMLLNINKSKGSNLIYSQFKTVEGLGVFGIALRANGFAEIVIEGSDQNPTFSAATLTSLAKGSAEKRFIFFTGEGSKERRNLILNIFNGNFDKLPIAMRTPLEGFSTNKNTKGEICWVIGITGAGAEGISLKCCRSVHIMEPYWNNVRLEQVKGRAIRICSHKDLPYDERTVEIYTYYTVFSKRQLAKLDTDLKTTDKGKTSDENVFEVSTKKDKINQSLLQVMKEAAVDCGLNAADNKDVQCFTIEDGRPDKYLFDPKLEVDNMLTRMEYKKVEVAVKEEKAERSVRTIEVPVLRYGPPENKIEYLYYYKVDDSTKYSLYHRDDIYLKNPIGESEMDLDTKKPRRIALF